MLCQKVLEIYGYSPCRKVLFFGSKKSTDIESNVETENKYQEQLFRMCLQKKKNWKKNRSALSRECDQVSHGLKRKGMTSKDGYFK